MEGWEGGRKDGKKEGREEGKKEGVCSFRLLKVLPHSITHSAHPTGSEVQGVSPCRHPIHSLALQLGQTDRHGMPRADGTGPAEQQQGAAEDPSEEGPVLQSCGTVGTRVARRRARQRREQAESKMLRAQPHVLRRGPFRPQAAPWGRQCHGWRGERALGWAGGWHPHGHRHEHPRLAARPPALPRAGAACSSCCPLLLLRGPIRPHLDSQTRGGCWGWGGGGGTESKQQQQEQS